MEGRDGFSLCGCQNSRCPTCQPNPVLPCSLEGRAQLSYQSSTFSQYLLLFVAVEVTTSGFAKVTGKVAGVLQPPAPADTVVGMGSPPGLPEYLCTVLHVPGSGVLSGLASCQSPHEACSRFSVLGSGEGRQSFWLYT